MSVRIVFISQQYVIALTSEKNGRGRPINPQSSTHPLTDHPIIKSLVIWLKATLHISSPDEEYLISRCAPTGGNLITQLPLVTFFFRRPVLNSLPVNALRNTPSTSLSLNFIFFRELKPASVALGAANTDISRRAKEKERYVKRASERTRGNLTDEPGEADEKTNIERWGKRRPLHEFV